MGWWFGRFFTGIADTQVDSLDSTFLNGLKPFPLEIPHMRCPTPILGVVALLLVAGTTGQAAAPKEPADLLPAKTLASLEVRNPAAIAREVSQLIRGSHLDDMPTFLGRAKAKLGPQDQMFYGFEMLGASALLFSPEMLSEAARVQGGAIALTGLGKNLEPEIIGFVQSGDSNFFPLYMRAFLSFGPTRIVGEAEGIPLFRQMNYVWEPPAQPGAPPGGNANKYRESGPVMALQPGGLLVFGSSIEAVKDFILRLKGKASTPSLGEVRAYKDAATRFDKAGLFGYLDMNGLTAQMDDLMKNAPPSPITAQWTNLQATMNPKAIRSLTTSLTLHNGSLEWQARLEVDGRHKSPVLALLSEKSSGNHLLAAVPRDTVGVVTMGIDDGARVWANLLAIADAQAKISLVGDMNLPSKMIAQAEGLIGLKIQEEVFARLTGIALSAEGILVLGTVDEETARFLEEKAIPKLISLMAPQNGVPTPKREEIDGQVIHSLDSPVPGSGLAYGRRGKILALSLGMPRETAASLSAASRKKDLLSEERFQASLADKKNPLLLGVGSTRQVLHQLLKSSPSHPAVNPRPIPAPPVGPPPEIKPQDNGAQKALAQLDVILADLPLTLGTLQRQEDALTLEIRQSGLRTVAPRAINLMLETAVELAIRSRPGFIGIGGAAPVVKPVEIEKK